MRYKAPSWLKPHPKLILKSGIKQLPVSPDGVLITVMAIVRIPSMYLPGKPKARFYIAPVTGPTEPDAVYLFAPRDGSQPFIGTVENGLPVALDGGPNPAPSDMYRLYSITGRRGHGYFSIFMCVDGLSLDRPKSEFWANLSGLGDKAKAIHRGVKGSE